MTNARTLKIQRTMSMTFNIRKIKWGYNLTTKRNNTREKHISFHCVYDTSLNSCSYQKRWLFYRTSHYVFIYKNNYSLHKNIEHIWAILILHHSRKSSSYRACLILRWLQIEPFKITIHHRDKVKNSLRRSSWKFILKERHVMVHLCI